MMTKYKLIKYKNKNFKLFVRFNSFLLFFVESKKVSRRDVERNKIDDVNDVYSPLFGAPRDRAYLSLLQNKVRNISAREHF